MILYKDHSNSYYLESQEVFSHSCKFGVKIHLSLFFLTYFLHIMSKSLTKCSDYDYNNANIMNFKYISEVINAISYKSKCYVRYNVKNL